jgi:hypothetical protein
VESGEEAAVAAAAQNEGGGAEPEHGPQPEADAGDRIDAARERLRARIEPPDPDAD